ncbi:Ig-like domain-containing protein [Aliikangiella sp. G2MR2-5]|uniref:Ig-like domain-containing protein n=1 Tax=Aliikangiella sp. G2MR2-5 TaxID=2788943 RepID=UPI0018AB68CC|nr:Ig-like domain-containing protein [Aliikangiella sp. G2MR2-5]
MKFVVNNVKMSIFAGLILHIFSVTTVKSEECELYPITVSTELFSEISDGQAFHQIPLGVGKGNYSWLSWDGRNDSPSLAESLLRPGNSHIYINPNDAQDTQLDPNDWVQGRPGVKNSSSIRANLDVLLNVPIQIPVWSENLGQGSQFDYLVSSFATIELTDYKLNGKGWISFIYHGDTSCAENSPPQAFSVSLQTTESTSFIFTVTAEDPDLDPLDYIVVQPPQNGLLVGNGDNGEGPEYTYTPNSGFTGLDEFQFIANDGTNDSNIATVSISIIPFENNPPVAYNASLETTESIAFDVVVEANDPDMDPLTYEIVNIPTNGILTGDGPNYIYTPNAGFVGTDTFSFLANDGTDDSNIATVSIQVNPAANTAPTIEPATHELPQFSSLEFIVDAFDADGDPLTYIIVDYPLSGEITGSGPDFIYTPIDGAAGVDSMRIKVNDGKADSETVEITFIVFPSEE